MLGNSLMITSMDSMTSDAILLTLYYLHDLDENETEDICTYHNFLLADRVTAGKILIGKSGLNKRADR